MNKFSFAALLAMAGIGASPYKNPFLVANGRSRSKPRKYAPKALPKGESGAKLRRKAREGKLGIAVLK